MALSFGDLSLHCGPKALGAPDDLLEVIIGFIDGARKTLDVAAQELESEPIARAIITARQRWAASRPVRNAGARLYRTQRDRQLGKLHHKLMVLDRQVVIAGSFNYTRAASRVNDENIVIVGDFEARGRRARSAQRRFARYALKEIERIIADHAVAI